MWPQKVLMVSPEAFDIKYIINKHMQTPTGKLKTVNRTEAHLQWKALRDVFSQLGLTVEVLAADPDLPDMVFCANQIFPFVKDNKRQIILSNMHSDFRRNEVAHFRTWAEKQNFIIHELPKSIRFEGMGDLLCNYATGELFGGYGFRTDESVYDLIESLVGQKIHRLQLVNENFYHLDTCLSLLDAKTALYVPSAYSPTGLQLLRSHFPHLIAISDAEAIDNLAGNACCPNGKDVVIQKGSKQTIQQIKHAGFNVIEVETSEFIKAGGSVFCMKMLI